MKILIPLGTRPEIIRLAPTIIELRKFHKVILAFTNQNFDPNLSNIFFEDLGIEEPKHKRKEFSGDPIDAISDILRYINSVIKLESPDVFLILGDTNSCLTAIIAKKYKIPVFHLEAGNRSFDENIPEEINRRLIDHISDVNICYSEYARDNLLREGVRKSTTFVIGSPLYELFMMYKPKAERSNILIDLNIKRNEYIVLSIHRQENTEDLTTMSAFLDKLDDYTNELGLRVVFPVHPRLSDKLKKFYKNIKLIKPQNYTDYIALQVNSKVVMSDSGSLTEESSILGFKAINLRTTNERQESEGSGVLMMVGLDIEKVKLAMKIINSNSGKFKEYENINFSSTVNKLIISYTSYVNKYIYLK